MSETTQEGAHQVAPVDPVFPRFFKEGEEQQPKLVGLIAYGLYEEARREWVDAFKGREGRYSLYFSLGIAKDGQGLAGVHTAQFTINRAALPYGVHLMTSLARIGTTGAASWD